MVFLRDWIQSGSWQNPPRCRKLARFIQPACARGGGNTTSTSTSTSTTSSTRECVSSRAVLKTTQPLVCGRDLLGSQGAILVTRVVEGNKEKSDHIDSVAEDGFI
ncbi:hypothetical protein DPEC_G00074600 [Dallia pectoralis]|uniref:Uncharacterized protein n=1 Tax=Dallia pectoralis TaxID=75939 RepID=A0ACC2H3P3_DALPE|nr:hypothetical protein DPEC_G00074600 [Dallia pectoralis]